MPLFSKQHNCVSKHFCDKCRILLPNYYLFVPNFRERMHLAYQSHLLAHSWFLQHLVVFKFVVTLQKQTILK